MPIVYTDNANYANIANAIREKLGTQSTFYPSGMVAAIESINSTGKVDEYEPTWDEDATEHGGTIVVCSNVAFFTGFVRYDTSLANKTICTVPASIAPPVPFEIHANYGGRANSINGEVDEFGRVKINYSSTQYVYFWARWPILKKTGSYEIVVKPGVTSSDVVANVCGDMVFCYGNFNKSANEGDAWLELFTIPEAIRPSSGYIPSVTTPTGSGGFPNSGNIYDTIYDPETGVISAWIPRSIVHMFLNFAWKLNTEV